MPQCPSGVAVALWTIDGNDHLPIRGQAAGAALLDWRFAHPKRR
jgi:hypothetical protein